MYNYLIKMKIFQIKVFTDWNNVFDSWKNFGNWWSSKYGSNVGNVCYNSIARTYGSCIDQFANVILFLYEKESIYIYAWLITSMGYRTWNCFKVSSFFFLQYLLEEIYKLFATINCLDLVNFYLFFYIN